jgi:hypothetical protein
MRGTNQSASAIYRTGSSPWPAATPRDGRATYASFTKGTSVHQKIDSVRSANSAVLEHQLPALQAELDKQRRCRMNRLDELMVAATEAVATGDECRLQVTRVRQVAAEPVVGEIDIALERLENGSYEYANASPSRSRLNVWMCCR